MADSTIGRLMNKLDDPDYVLKQTKYENARISVKLGWELASKMKNDSLAELSATARYLSSEIEKDFNTTISILDSEESGSKSKPS